MVIVRGDPRDVIGDGGAQGAVTSPARQRSDPGAVAHVAVGLAVVSLTCTAAAVALRVRASTDITMSSADVVIAVVYPVLAAVVLRADARHRVGLLLLPTALLGPYLLAGVHAADAAASGDGGALAMAASWLAMWGFTPYWVVIALVPLYLPDGRLPGPRWRSYVRVLAVLQLSGLLAAMVADREADVSELVTNPLAVSGAAFLGLVLAAGVSSFVVGGLVSAASLVVRLRRSTGLERAQLGWLVLGAVSLAGFVLLSIPFRGTALSEILLAAGLTVLPLTVGVAVVRHQLFDIAVALPRAIVYALSTFFVLACYAAIVVTVGGLAAGTRWALPVIALAALLAASVGTQLQHLVERLLYGERRDPYAIVARTGRRVDEVPGPAEAIEVLVAEVRDLLRVPWVAVVPSDQRLAPVIAGALTGHHDHLPLTVHGALVGEFRVGHRRPGERLRRSERDVLAEVARRAATLVWSALLVDDLRTSRDEVQRRRELVVVAREEERRRIRRDLHDGVGPELAGMALQMDRLTGRLVDPVLAADATALRDQLRRTVTAVRSVVDGLRPPALDELGLVGALRAHALASSDTDDGPLVEVRERGVGELSAAVEVAAYRIATEAVANAVRHGRARRVLIEIGTDGGALVVRVADDGVGVSAGAVPGVGTTSMRERASELGGSLELAPAAGGGAVVTARFPLRTP